MGFELTSIPVDLNVTGTSDCLVTLTVLKYKELKSRHWLIHHTRTHVKEHEKTKTKTRALTNILFLLFEYSYPQWLIIRHAWYRILCMIKLFWVYIAYNVYCIPVLLRVHNIKGEESVLLQYSLYKLWSITAKLWFL